MSYSDLASYTVTLLAITLAPGPVALVLIVRSASEDVLGAISFGIGFALGGVVVIFIVCFGLGAWLTAVPESFEYSKYFMMAYMTWLARGVWKGGFDLAGECHGKHYPVVANSRNEFIDKEIRVKWGNEIIETGTLKFGALIGDGCRIGANAVLAPGTVLESNTVIPRLALVDQLLQR